MCSYVGIRARPVSEVIPEWRALRCPSCNRSACLLRACRCTAQQQEADQAEEDDAGERVGGGREERLAVVAVGEVAVEDARVDTNDEEGGRKGSGKKNKEEDARWVGPWRRNATQRDIKRRQCAAFEDG